MGREVGEDKKMWIHFYRAPVAKQVVTGEVW